MDNITDAVLTTDQPEQATIVLLTVDVISCMVQTPDGHLAPSYTISRRGPSTAASNCGHRHGGYTGWRGSENSRRGLVISPL